MKGVIMAGGKGTRLRPLTCNIPKPMVPLLDKPVMEYSIELFKQHGIFDIAVTLQYLPQSIRNYFGDGKEFGVNLYYFEEEDPLGTAGSIRNAMEFLDETFLVISGDALTDFDLSAGIEFHYQKNALCTIFTKQVQDPLDFGLVLTNKGSQVKCIIEKPKWNEVCSDIVNTGIYIMEPEIFHSIRKDEVVDFSQDVFPALIKKEAKLYAFLAEGYWSDIGNLEQYRRAHYDLLGGFVNYSHHSKEIRPGIYTGSHVTIEEGACIEGPVFIGDHTTIRRDAKVESFSVIGKHSIISSKASIKKSVIWHDSFIGNNCELYGAVVANHNSLKTGSTLYEGSVIGSECNLGERVVLRPSVKVWPNKQIEDHVVIHSSFNIEKKIRKQTYNSEQKAQGKKSQTII